MQTIIVLQVLERNTQGITLTNSGRILKQRGELLIRMNNELLGGHSGTHRAESIPYRSTQPSLFQLPLSLCYAFSDSRCAEVLYARYLRCVEIWSARNLASCQTPQMKEDPRRDCHGNPRK
jgi:hypothetical protein